VLDILDVYKSFGSKPALAGVSFTIQPGQILAVLGPSGCGKSTLLSIIAGLERADQGDVTWEGASLAAVPPYRRNFGLMFQDFALFPHKNVFENVAFGLRMQQRNIDEIEPKVAQALELVGLPGFASRDVNTLSGGEQQRVALARALAPQPRLLMLDEPLGSLDRGLRERLALELRENLQRSHQTALYVTHDQEEAFTLADRLVVMNAGRIEQNDLPESVYRQPANSFVARFLGLNNLLNGTVQLSSAGEKVLVTNIGPLPLPDSTQAVQPGSQVCVLLRPDEVSLGDSGAYWLQGVLTETVFRGSLTRATLLVHDTPLIFDFPSRYQLPGLGQAIRISFEPSQAIQIFNS